ncbi:MAG: hypothetical protein ACI4L5_04595 [Negativibacillus sp.]
MIPDEKHAAVQEVLKQVIAIAKPEAVFLYNCKHDLDGELTSFKLCVICEYENKRRLLTDIFDVDCETPFDVLLYTKEQFRQLRDDTAAFANRVFTKGKMLYGQK